MSMRFIYWPAIICLAFVTSSCLDDMENPEEQLIREQDEMIMSYLDSNNIDATKTRSGVYYEVLKQNSSGVAVKDEHIVYIHYVLRDLAGNLIDSLYSSADSVETVRFYQSPQAIVPRGFYIGADLMNVGEKLRIFMPSYQAFYDFSYKTLIASHEPVIADMEVVKVESLEAQQAREEQAIEDYIAEHELDSVQHLSSGIYYQQLTQGSGDQAKSGDAVRVSYKGLYLDGTAFDESEKDKPLEFILGRKTYIEGFEAGVKQMRKGEKARIFIPSHLAYGPSLEVIPKIIRDEFVKDMLDRSYFKPFTPVIFELELLDVK